MSVLCGTVLVGLRVTDVTLVVPFHVKNVITRWQQSDPLGSSTGQGGQCLFSYNCLVDCVMVSDNLSAVHDELFAFSALTLLVGRQEGHPACKKQWLSAGVVVCLEQGADLHMAQLMPLPLTVSCFSKTQIGFFLSGTGSPG